MKNRATFVLVPAAILFLSGCAAGPKAGAVRPGLDVGALQKELVAKLAGQAEIRPGLKVANRAAPEAKQAVRIFLVETWTKLGLDVRKHDYSAEGENIYAVVEATVPSDELVVVGAHYDTARNSPGANDNATGAALVTAAAAEMARTKPRSRDFVFVLFDEEERGMRGSRAFAQKLKDENRKVHSVHTADQVGWDQDGDRTIELEIPYDGAVALYEAAARSMPAPVPILVTKETGSDHSAFRRLGYPAVGITEEYRNKDTTPHIHKPTDTADTVDYGFLRSTTELVVRVLKTLAR
jgi:Zn-dependent M28 family amino/carboxypeptidase